MSYKVIKEGEWPHIHARPSVSENPPGTIIECDCGTRFILQPSAHSQMPEWRPYPLNPPPRPPEERG